MKDRRIYYLSVVAAMLLVFLMLENKNAFSGTSLLVNDVAPDFSLKDLQGEKVSLSDLKGKVVLINFWASWCPQCRNEIPGFQKMYEAHRDKGFSIIGIALDDVTPSSVKQLKLTYPIVRTNDKLVKDYGGIKAIPTSFLVGRNGRIIKKIKGEYLEDILKTDLENALKK
ncbi:MAG: TlpA family protein disulfide reductase [Nitrospirae bacterium]|nr:TlpA family protein disulfide reductase [Nitrospirota bacterium]